MHIISSTIHGIISGAPIWVWLLLIYLIKNGIEALYERTVKIKKLMLMPVLLFLWSFYSLIQKNNDYALFIWLGCISLGIYLGWKSLKSKTIIVDKEKKELRIPGSIFTLLIVIPFFVIKFVLNSLYHCHTSYIGYLLLFDGAISGIVSGLMVGRLIFYYLKFKHGEKAKKNT